MPAPQGSPQGHSLDPARTAGDWRALWLRGAEDQAKMPGLGSRAGGAMQAPCGFCGFLACAPSGLLAASISCRLVSGSCGTTAPGSESHAANALIEQQTPICMIWLNMPFFGHIQILFGFIHIFGRIRIIGSFLTAMHFQNASFHQPTQKITCLY